MFKLLKGAHCFTPDDAGFKDVLVCFDKIGLIQEEISAAAYPETEVIDCQGCFICPGLIDQHVHITGGGGEQGPVSRIPEIVFSQVVEAGVTCVVGVLGFDSVSRSIAGLLAKARGLEAEGISTYIYTGSYASPTETLTGRVLNDIVLLDKVLGVGEVAISDHRSFHPSLQELQTLAAEAYAGGLLGGKAGVLHLHVGEGRHGLAPLFQLINESDFPIETFVPTHLNRNPRVFEQGIELLRDGGNIDLTAGETSGYSIPTALTHLLDRGAGLERVTLSSDGNGSVPANSGGSSGVGGMGLLFEDVRASVIKAKLDFASVIRTVTSNPARVLKLFPRKGSLSVGSDADILVLKEDDLSIFLLLARGQVVVEEQKAVKKGRFES